MSLKPAYAVNLTVRARRDLALLFEDIDAKDSEAAWHWYMSLKQAILSLEKLPTRCPRTPENARLRHLLYGSKPDVYHVIYRVREKGKQVDVLHIRHGARQPFKRSEVTE